MDREHSCTETVEGAAGALERVDDVECGDGLALCVLSVGDGVADDLEEGFKSATVPMRQKATRQLTFSRKILRTPRVSS
jgi:hypothetical protein